MAMTAEVSITTGGCPRAGRPIVARRNTPSPHIDTASHPRIIDLSTTAHWPASVRTSRTSRTSRTKEVVLLVPAVLSPVTNDIEDRQRSSRPTDGQRTAVGEGAQELEGEERRRTQGERVQLGGEEPGAS
jgi:hypothetical protein